MGGGLLLDDYDYEIFFSKIPIKSISSKTESMKESSDDLQIDTTTERKQYLTCQPFLPNSVSPAADGAGPAFSNLSPQLC